MKRSRLSTKEGRKRVGRLKVWTNYELDVEAVRTAYADSFGYPKGALTDDPRYTKWWNVVSKKRNLNWTGTNFYKPDMWLKLTKPIGEYNKFTPEKTYKMLRDLPVEVKLAREGSVAVYVWAQDKKTLDEVAKRFNGYADEINFVTVPHMVMQKEKDMSIPLIMSPEKGEKARYLRLWFD